MDNYTTIEEHGYTTTGMVGVPEYTMSDIYRFTSEEQAEYPTLLKRQWHSDCTRARDEAMAWVLGYEFIHATPLNKVAFENEITEQLKVLTDQDPGLKTEKFYYNGIIDYPKLGKYMGSLYPYPDKQRTVTSVVEKIEFLITHRDKQEDILPSDIKTEQPPILEDEDTHWLRQVLERLSSYWETTERYYILYAFRDYCEHKGYPWGESCMKFAKRIANLLPFKIKDTSLNTALCNAAKNIKIEESKSYHDLTNLLSKNIHDSDDAEEECKQWKNRLDIVKKAVELDSEK